MAFNFNKASYRVWKGHVWSSDCGRRGTNGIEWDAGCSVSLQKTEKELGYLRYPWAVAFEQENVQTAEANIKLFFAGVLQEIKEYLDIFYI